MWRSSLQLLDAEGGAELSPAQDVWGMAGVCPMSPWTRHLFHIWLVGPVIPKVICRVPVVLALGFDWFYIFCIILYDYMGCYWIFTYFCNFFNGCCHTLL